MSVLLMLLLLQYRMLTVRLSFCVTFGITRLRNNYSAID